jgi:hypothetical protein
MPAIGSMFPTKITEENLSSPDMDNLSIEEDEDLFLLARLEKQKSDKSVLNVTTAEWLGSQFTASFRAAKNLLSEEDELDVDGVDWEFWGNVMNDYEKTVRSNPRQFTRKLHKGIPAPVRGIMWQLMSNSKSEQLEKEYIELITRTSRCERLIERDLARTFPDNAYFKDRDGLGQRSLFNVLKAYSIYDPEIGYCQGLAFVVGALLLNMPEEQTFCVLVKLMNNYNFRPMYTPKMIGLQSINYQFDALIKEQVPTVAQYLYSLDIQSSMYASQWFMTIFAYRFPLDLVFRILDIIFAEGF